MPSENLPSSGADDRRLTAWPLHSVTDLIGGPLLTPATTRVLRGRIEPVAPPATAVLDERQFAVLAAVAARLIPQPGRPVPIDLAARLHRRLTDGVGDGWRYADQPADAELIARGLDALAAAGFPDRDGGGQDDLLHDVQAGRLEWSGISSARWFEEVLAAFVDLYYSHPLAQEEIGYAGMADARGWQDVGFGARAAHEPEPVA